MKFIYLFFTLSLVTGSEEFEGASRRCVARQLVPSRAVESNCEDEVCWLVLREDELHHVRSRISQAGGNRPQVEGLGFVAREFRVSRVLDLDAAHALFE